MPETIRDPGAFAYNYGAFTAAAFIVAHLIYGMIVGGMYTPVHTHALPPAGQKQVRGEEPVAAGHTVEHPEEPRVP